jgi:hypothetical protein
VKDECNKSGDLIPNALHGALRKSPHFRTVAVEVPLSHYREIMALAPDHHALSLETTCQYGKRVQVLNASAERLFSTA